MDYIAALIMISLESLEEFLLARLSIWLPTFPLVIQTFHYPLPPLIPTVVIFREAKIESDPFAAILQLIPFLLIVREDH